MTIAPAIAERGLVVPRIADVAPPTGPVGGDELCARIAVAMLDAGIADPKLWSRSWQREKAPTDFVAAALNAFVEQHGGEAVRRRFALELTIGDRTHGYGTADAGEAVLSINAMNEAAYLRLGHAARALVRPHRELPATIVRTVEQFSHVFPVYDWNRAEEYRENSLDMFVENDETESPQAKAFVEDHPPIKLPHACCGRGLSDRALRSIASGRPSRAREVAERCLAVRALVARIERDCEYFASQQPLCGEGDRLPILLAAIESRDQTCAAFDDEAQYWNEFEHDPTACWPVGLDSVGATRQAFGWLASAIELLAAMSRLIDVLPGNERYVYRTRRHRPFVNRGGPTDGRLFFMGSTFDGNLFGDPGGFSSDIDEDVDEDDFDEGLGDEEAA